MTETMEITVTTGMMMETMEVSSPYFLCLETRNSVSTNIDLLPELFVFGICKLIRCVDNGDNGDDGSDDSDGGQDGSAGTAAAATTTTAGTPKAGTPKACPATN